MTRWVIIFLILLFLFIFWVLSSVYIAANEFDPLDPALSAFCEESDIATDSETEVDRAR